MSHQWEEEASTEEETKLFWSEPNKFFVMAQDVITDTPNTHMLHGCHQKYEIKDRRTHKQGFTGNIRRPNEWFLLIFQICCFTLGLK